MQSFFFKRLTRPGGKPGNFLVCVYFYLSKAFDLATAPSKWLLIFLGPQVNNFSIVCAVSKEKK